jgi:hypothetical protein
MNTPTGIRCLEAIIDNFGIYPAGWVHQDGTKTKRTEWQEGWNAAVEKLYEKCSVFVTWYKNLPADAKPIIDFLIEEDVFLFEDNGKITVAANCNDLFAWACSDFEPIEIDQLPIVFEMVKKYKNGMSRWACIKRNSQPQKPVIDYWKEAGLWDDVLEALPVSGT